MGGNAGRFSAAVGAGAMTRVGGSSCTCAVEQSHPGNQLGIGGRGCKRGVAAQAVAHENAAVLHHVLHERGQLALPDRIVGVGHQRFV